MIYSSNNNYRCSDRNCMISLNRSVQERAQTICHIIKQTNSKKKTTITPSIIISAMIIGSGLQCLPHMSLWIWRGAVIKLMLEGVAFPFFTCSYLRFTQSHSRNNLFFEKKWVTRFICRWVNEGVNKLISDWMSENVCKKRLKLLL